LEEKKRRGERKNDKARESNFVMKCFWLDCVLLKSADVLEQGIFYTAGGKGRTSPAFVRLSFVQKHTIHILRWNSWTSIWQKTPFFSMLFTVPSTGGFLKKNQTLYSGLKKHTKIRETRMNSIL
jgi:hypothetical protein